MLFSKDSSLFSLLFLTQNIFLLYWQQNSGSFFISNFNFFIEINSFNLIIILRILFLLFPVTFKICKLQLNDILDLHYPHMLLGIRWKAKVGGFVSLLILFLAHKFQIAWRKFRFGFYIFRMAFSYVFPPLHRVFMQMHEKCHDYRVFVFFLTRSCSASMLDVVCLHMSDPALTSWVVSTHKLLHIRAYVWVLHVRRVCGLIIEMVPQGDVSPTSQTLSFILVVSGTLPTPPHSFSMLPVFIYFICEICIFIC